MFLGYSLWTPYLKRCHKFSIGLRSCDWLGHGRTFIFFFWNHSFVKFAVCLGSLSCWKVYLRHPYNFLALGSIFFSNISLYMNLFILPSMIWRSPTPWAVKKPHTMMLPPPCFMVGTVFLGSEAVPRFLHTCRASFQSKSSILLSSDHLTRSQNSFPLSRWSLANIKRLLTCFTVRRGL